MTDAILVYTTVANEDEALLLARTLVGERLVACANLLPRVHSVYRWDGQVEESQEVLLLLKTHRNRQAAVIERIRCCHSYDCPAITVLPLIGGNPDFLAWITAETCDEESL